MEGSVDIRRQFVLVGAGCVLGIVWAAFTFDIAAQGPLPKSGTSPPNLGFEVATVRRSSARSGDSLGSKAEGRGGGADPEFRVEHERFSAINIRLYGLIVKAYGLTGCRPLTGQCVLLSGGPDWIGPAWLRKDGFDITAKAPDGSPDYTLVQFLNGRAPQLQAMLRVLLEDRFRLKLHYEKRQLPVYVVAKGNREPKLRRADQAQESVIAFRPVVQSNGDNAIELFSKNGTLDELAGLLSKFMDRPVLNQTGIQGSFDFTIDYDTNSDAPGPFSGAVGPGMFRAFQDQLGLKLQATKGLVDVLVVDRADRPSAEN
jgi:uncharacterized protein (TIGR03435 family)